MNEFGQSVIWLALQVTLFVGVLSLVYLTLRRFGPRTGAAVACAALFGITVITVSFFLPWPRWHLVHSRPENPEIANLRTEGISSTADPPTDRPVANEPEHHEDAVSSEEHLPTAAPAGGSSLVTTLQELTRGLTLIDQKVAADRSRWPTALAIGFGVSLVLATLRLIVGVVVVGHQRRCSREITDATLHESVCVLCARLGETRNIELRESPHLSTPATVGWRRPTILLPRGWQGWPDMEQRSVLAHEVSHIARRDFPLWIAAQIAVVLHFYHPLVHWLSRRLRLEQELAADSTAARLVGGREQYLTTLVNTALREPDDRLAWAAQAFLPTRTTFLRRIEMLRDPRSVVEHRLASVARQLSLVFVVSFGLAVAGMRAPGQGAEPPGTAAAEVAKTVDSSNDHQPSERLDLSFYPEDAVYVLSVRPADLCAVDAIAPLAKQANVMVQLRGLAGMEAEEIAKHINAMAPQRDEADEVAVEQIDEFMAIPYGKPNQWSGVRFVLRMIDPINIDRLHVPWIHDPVRSVHADKTLVMERDEPEGQGYCVMDARTVVFDRADRLRRILDRAQPGAELAMAKAWKGLHTGQAILAIDVANLALLDSELPDLTVFAPMFVDIKQLLVSVNVSGPIQLTGLATCRSPEAATRVKRTVEALSVLARNAVAEQRRVLDSRVDQGRRVHELAMLKSGIQLAVEVFDGVQVTTDKTTVRLLATHSQSDTSPVLGSALLEALGAEHRETARWQLSTTAVEMNQYRDDHGHFPPAVVYGPDGKTPHSWRVALLPYVGEKELYDRYRLDEPWDSEHNKKLLASIPRRYRSPSDRKKSTNASYFVLTGPETAFAGRDGTKTSDIRDGMSRTLLVVEARRNIPWTKPEDIPYRADQPLPQLGGFHAGEFQAAFADARAVSLSQEIDETTLRRMIEKADGNHVDVDGLR